MAEAHRGRGRVCRRGRGRGVDPEEDKPPNRRRDQRDLEIAAKRRRIRELERQLAEVRTDAANEEGEEESASLGSSATGEDDEGFNQWGIPNQRRNRRPGLKPVRSYQTLGMKIDLPEFEGISHPDEFIDWLHTVERVFEVKNLNDSQKVKLVAIKLRKHASIWWEHVKTRRAREGKPKIQSWSKMKKKLIAKFLPAQYRQEAFIEYHHLNQRDMPVEQYTNEFDVLRMRCDAVEEKEQISRGGSVANQRCFKSQGLGHLIADCPNRQLVTLVEEDVDLVYDDYEDYDEGLEDHLTEGEEITYADSGESIVVRSGIAEAIILATDEIVGHVRNKDAIVHSYNNGFSGFAARLSEAESKSIAQRPGVISVFPDPILQLHTTRSWDFLQYQTEVVITSGGSDNSSTKGADTIIGILDTGIWPEAESFNDNDMSEVPSRWKGTCMKSHDSSSFKCNKKLVGARFYGDDDEDGIKPSGSARDQNGHGTHVASTAAGSPISGASYYGLGSGIAKGGSPGSRIAMYRVCTDGGCHGSSIMKAFDDAIADRVDVLSLSLGSLSGLQAEFSSDPVAIGAFHAVEKGIFVGNQGPQAETVVNVVPWILTVAATTIDRDFETHIVLGGNKVMIKGGGISFGNLTSSPVYPLITGDLAKSADSDVSRYCLPDSVGIFAISHSCSGVAAQACGLVSLEPTKIAEVLKDRPSWFRDCRNVKVFTMFSAGSGGTVKLLLIPSGYLIRPYDGGGSIIHIVDHLNLESWSAPEILCPLYESSKDVDGTLVWSAGAANKFVSGIKILDTGNLVLQDISNQTVWQSFDHPTDALLPGQKLRAVKEIELALKNQLIISTALMTVGITIVSWTCLPSSFTIFNFGTQKVVKNWELFLCVAVDLWAGLIIRFITEYYTSNAYSPVQDVADSCRTGAATNVIFGLALGYKSVLSPIFAIGSAALVSLALFGAFVSRAAISAGEVLTPQVFIGLIVGAMLPYWFSAMTMKSVGNAALKMVEEVRRQFNTIPGLMEGHAKPDYATGVKISTDASITGMIPPGALVMLTPLIAGIFFGVLTLSGVLAGALVSGLQIAISTSNTGGA